MILKIPKHLTDLNIVLQMHQLVSEYSSNYYEDTSGEDYLYLKDLNFDYVREFIEMSCPNSDIYTIDYLTNLFYKIKGATEVFNQVENHLGIKFKGKPRYQINYLLYEFEVIKTNNINGYFRAFKNFLRSLLYFVNDGTDSGNNSELLPDEDDSDYVFTDIEGNEVISIEKSSNSSFTGNIDIISTKDNNPQGYKVVVCPPWMSVEITNEGIKYSATENTSESSRTGVIYLQQDESGKVIVITISQPGTSGGGGTGGGDVNPPGEIKYVFTDSNGNTSVRDDSHSKSSSEFTGSTQIISTKNGSFTEFTVSSNSDWLTPRIEGSKIIYDATKNDQESPRIGIITAVQKETGKVITITVVQGGTDETIVIPDPDDYVFTTEDGGTSVTDISHSQSPDGFEGKVEDIISTKNDKDIGYTASSDSDWLHVEIDENRDVIYTADDNEDEFPRTGTITVVQDESGKVITITVTQGGKGGSESNRYNFTDIYFNTSATDSRKEENNKSFTDSWYMISNKDNSELVGFSTSCDSDWLTVSNNITTITYTATENKSEETRTATITAIQNESGKIFILKVVQGGYMVDPDDPNPPGDLTNPVDLIEFIVDDELLCLSDMGVIMYKEYSFNFDNRDQD